MWLSKGFRFMQVRLLKFKLLCMGIFSILPVSSWAAAAWCPLGAASETCFSNNRGEELYCWTQIIIAGNLGTMVGLVIAFSGFVTWIWQKSVIGIVILLLGVSITAFPGLYQSFLGTLGKITAGQSSSENRIIDRYAPNCGSGGGMSVVYPPNCGLKNPGEC